MARRTYDRPMPERGHLRRPIRVVTRFPLTVRPMVAALVLAALTASCGGESPGEADGGFLQKLAKDAEAVDAEGASSDAGVAAPDAAPPPDRDQDGIPDAEDPAPDRANNRLFADEFDRESMDWLFTSNAMRIESTQGLLVVPEAEPFVREGWLGARPTWSDVFIRALIRVVRVGPSNDRGAGRAGVLARVHQVAPDRYLLCGLDLKNHLAFLSFHNGGDAAGTTLQEAPLQGELGDWIPVVFSTRASLVSCTVGGVQLTGAISELVAGSTGFRVFDTAFEAAWIEVYEL